jgi:IMP dehydrogenase
MLRALSFDDALLVPQFSEITSRKDINTSTCLDIAEKFKFRLPIVSSPMDTVTEAHMALAMELAGGFGIVHRYNSIAEQAIAVKHARKSGCNFVGAAIGVSGDYLERAHALIEYGVALLCVDIAHGHHALMRHALTTLRNTFGTKVHIMAGNVATLQGFNDLSDWGADSIRVGIGGGSICSTRIQTGHGVPTLQSVLWCAQSDRSATLIADGGVRSSGDIVKALAAGADMVMIGSLLAGTAETPGEVYNEDGASFKVYRGMASKEAQFDWRGHAASLEGVTAKVPFKGPVKDVLAGLETGLRSGLSYSGVDSIRELQAKSDFIYQTTAGREESSTHINNQY